MQYVFCTDRVWKVVVNDEESELKLEDFSVNEQEEVPNMFAGIVLSDSPSPTLGILCAYL